jgi:hypothetical protein
MVVARQWGVGIVTTGTEVDGATGAEAGAAEVGIAGMPTEPGFLCFFEGQAPS